MIDREKIIEKLEKEVKRTYAIKGAIWECGENGYEKISEEITEHREPFVTLTIEMADKILVLLKEQGPVEAEIKGSGSTWWHVCGECNGAIDHWDNYCKHCGRRIKHG